MEQIKTFSIVAGSMACNASCPGCIAGMTPTNGLTIKLPPVNWRNFDIACGLARDSHCTTAMITSKGEPTMFPDQITEYLRHMQPHKFRIIEMQTNGSYMADDFPKGRLTDQHLIDWYDLGMTTIAVSVVSYDAEKNRQIYFPRRKSYFDLPALIKKLHHFGFGVRLTTILADGFIDSVDEVKKLHAFAQEHKIDQLTCTPITKPDTTESELIYDWTAKHHIKDEAWKEITAYVKKNGSLLQRLEHGALVYDLFGQNVCLSNCITVDPDARQLRSIIFYPDGTVRSAWQHSGSVLLSGWRTWDPSATQPEKGTPIAAVLSGRAEKGAAVAAANSGPIAAASTPDAPPPPTGTAEAVAAALEHAAATPPAKPRVEILHNGRPVTPGDKTNVGEAAGTGVEPAAGDGAVVAEK